MQIAKHRHTNDPAALWWRESNAVPRAQRTAVDGVENHHRLLVVRQPSLLSRLRRASRTKPQGSSPAEESRKSEYAKP